ncbi:MAG: peptide MFS transporter [Anaeromyxobacter sp.]|nr:peptide MFS transporter [Anaeromyxobacter sp.]MBL0275178.1 peptide MFS transporter [Anaeromyxobacter sp.]
MSGPSAPAPRYVPPASKRELFGHPFGLWTLSLTEMWERFSYYGMRALLVYYLTKQLLLPGQVEHVAGFASFRGALEGLFGPMSTQQLASQIYGLYTGFVYLTPILGGWLADRYWGQRRTVVAGGVVMAVGQFVLMVPSLFLPGLLLLIIGNGMFKPNISTQVGGLYPPGDPRRDGAFNWFYVGVNMGAFFSGLVCGAIGETWGWNWGFGAAGVGMLAGLVQYLLGQKYLAPDNRMKAQADAAPADRAPFSKAEWSRILALVVLCGLNISFWAVYEQQGNTLALWADSNSDRHVLAFLGIGWEMPATWFQSVNPFFIAAFTPFINVFWARQARAGTEPSSVAKMAIGCGVLGASFLVMLLPARVVDAGQLASMWWLIGSTAMLTLGELYLSPVGLSLVTKISPPRIVSMMMGFWYLSSFFGNYLSGWLGTFWETMTKGSFFLMLAAISLVTGVLMVALYAPLRRAIGDENRGHDQLAS